MSGAWVAAATIASAAVSYHNGQQQKKSAEHAARQAEANAQRQAKQSDEEINRANQKRVNVSGALDAAMQAGKGGASGTLLTGPQGVDASSMSLGKNSLLG